MRPGAARHALAAALLMALAACSSLSGAPRPSPEREAAAPSGAIPQAPATAAPAAAAPGAAAPSATPPSRPQSDTAVATQALLAQSRAARAAGSYAQATATVERALRIDPNDARLWLELGEIELASGNPGQAATLARKALTLAADDRELTAHAERLLRAAGGS